MDLSTGVFPDIDVVRLLSESMPLGSPVACGGEDGAPFESEYVRHDVYGDDGLESSVQDYSRAVEEVCSVDVEVCRAYVVVRWSFDDARGGSGEGSGS